MVPEAMGEAEVAELLSDTFGEDWDYWQVVGGEVEVRTTTSDLTVRASLDDVVAKVAARSAGSVDFARADWGKVADTGLTLRWHTGRWQARVVEHGQEKEHRIKHFEIHSHH